MLADVQLDKYAIGHQVSNQLNEKNNNLPENKLDHAGNNGCYLKNWQFQFLALHNLVLGPF